VLFVVPKKASTAEKKIWGRKRHVLVDTQGHLLAVKVTGAHQSDQRGARSMLEPLASKLPRIKLLWGDTHYAGDMILWLLQHMGWAIEIVRRLKDSPSQQGTSQDTVAKEDKASSSGFRPLPRRWVVERSLAWITRWRRLCRDHEGLPASSEAFIKLSASRRMLSLLAPPFP